MKPLHIKEPYYTAGKIYKWAYKDIGVGINMKYLTGDGTLYLKIGDNVDTWEIEREKAREFIADHKTYHTARSTTLGIIPWEILSKVEDIRQPKLF